MIYYDIEYDRVIKLKTILFYHKNNYLIENKLTKIKYFYNFCNIMIKVYY